MKIFLLPVILLTCLASCSGQTQPANTTLLAEVKNKLSKGTSVSTILSDKNYLTIHPETEFRDLIKNNATTDILKISSAEEPGKKIKVLGMVRDQQGLPVAGALVYLYQTDAKGWYAAGSPHVLSNEGDMRHARLFGYVKTDAKGKFELHTVKPHGYPQSDLPAHIHVHVWADSYRDFVTEFLFDDDDRLVGKIREQSIRNQFMIVKPEKTTAPFDQQFSYKITLEK